MAGISTRTLRYYDQINLLKPNTISEAGYRFYSQKEVDRLQQILFYKELAMPLSDIQNILDNPAFDAKQAMESHLEELQKKQAQLSTLIANAQKTLQSIQGDLIMSNEEKFKGFMQELIEENEKEYGEEMRKKYGEPVIEQANAKKLGMTEEKYEHYLAVEKELHEMLRLAVETQDPASEAAQKAAALHKEWLMFSLPNYNPEIHLQLAEMYVQDERFTAYYNKIAPNCASFLQKALTIYLQSF